MNIEVRRSGGFAGIVRRGEVDTTARSDATDLHQLVEQAGLPAPAGDPPGEPDRFVYTITIDGTATRIGETALNDPQRELITRILG